MPGVLVTVSLPKAHVCGVRVAAQRRPFLVQRFSLSVGRLRLLTLPLCSVSVSLTAVRDCVCSGICGSPVCFFLSYYFNPWLFFVCL